MAARNQGKSYQQSSIRVGLHRLRSPQEGGPRGGCRGDSGQAPVHFVPSFTVSPFWVIVNETSQVPGCRAPGEIDGAQVNDVVIRGAPGVQMVSQGQEAADIGRQL